MPIADLTNIISVSLSSIPSGLGDFNTNSIGLFTTDQLLAPEQFIVAVNANQIAEATGSNSITAKMGTALFSSVPNLRTGRGQVFIFPYSATSATSATITTISITSEIITSLKALSNADLTITIDGTDYTAEAINFTAVNTVADIVKVLVAQNLDCNITVADTDKIQFQSRRYGLTESTIALKATSGGDGTDIYGSNYLDGANATSVAGADETGTTLADAVTYAESLAFFGGIITTQNCTNATILANSTSIQAKDKVYFETTQSRKNIPILGASIKSAGNTKTRLLCYSYAGADGAKTAISAYATVAQSVNYSGTDTCNTMQLKTLTGIQADLNLTQTDINNAKTNGVDIYPSTAGVSGVYSNSNGLYTDQAVNQLWLKKKLEVVTFNVLKQSNTKIPQTEQGMVILKNAVETAFIQSIRNGFVGQGIEWRAEVPIPFGDPETFKDNMEEQGYYIYSLPIGQQAQTERADRIAPVIQTAIQESGALHSGSIIVNVIP